MISICAIARDEGEYLADWCRYHLDMGVDRIYVYDQGGNGGFTDPNLIRVPFQTTDGCPQAEAYRDYLFKYQEGRTAFIDIDEFLTGDLSVLDDDTVPCFRIYSMLYGDSNMIYRTPGPVWERLTVEARRPSVSSKLAVIGREWDPYNPHGFRGRGEYRAVDGRPVSRSPVRFPYQQAVWEPLYIRHYRTKTLEEFCRQKLGKPRVLVPSVLRGKDYYFAVNERTPEKERYMEEYIHANLR